jgi:hypothetical protein
MLQQPWKLWLESYDNPEENIVVRVSTIAKE